MEEQETEKTNDITDGQNEAVDGQNDVAEEAEEAEEAQEAEQARSFEERLLIAAVAEITAEGKLAGSVTECESLPFLSDSYACANMTDTGEQPSLHLLATLYNADATLQTAQLTVIVTSLAPIDGNRQMKQLLRVKADAGEIARAVTSYFDFATSMLR